MADGKITLSLDYGNIKNDFQSMSKMIDDCAQTLKKKFEAIGSSFQLIPEFLKTITFTPILQSVNDFLSQMNEVPKKITDTFNVFDQIKGNIGKLSDNLKNAKEYTNDFMESFQKNGLIDTLGESFLGLNTTMLGIGIVILAVGAALAYLYTNSEDFRNLVDEGLNILMELLMNLYTNVLQPLFALLKDLIDTIILPLVSILADVFVTVIGVIFSLLMTLWNQVLAPIANFIVDVFAMAIQSIIDIWETWEPIVEQIMKIIGMLWDNILKPIAIWIQDVLCGVIEYFGTFVSGTIQFVKDIFKGILDFFVGIFTCDMDKAWKGICEVFNAAFKLICNLFSPIVEWFSGLFSDAWEGIKGAFSGIKDFFSGVWDGITGVFGNVVGWFKDRFSEAWTAVKNVFSAGGKIFDGIKDGIVNALKNVINAIIIGINKVIAFPFNSLNSALKIIKGVDILGFKPFSWIDTISVPQIPKLARGGIVNRPTLAMIGEAGREAVLPLQNNIQWMDTLVDKLQGNHENTTIVLQVGGEELYRWFIKNKKKNDFVMNGG